MKLKRRKIGILGLKAEAFLEGLFYYFSLVGERESSPYINHGSTVHGTLLNVPL